MSNEKNVSHRNARTCEFSSKRYIPLFTVLLYFRFRTNIFTQNYKQSLHVGTGNISYFTIVFSNNIGYKLGNNTV